jgi:hypothetical protein
MFQSIFFIFRETKYQYKLYTITVGLLTTLKFVQQLPENDQDRSKHVDVMTIACKKYNFNINAFVVCVCVCVCMNSSDVVDSSVNRNRSDKIAFSLLIVVTEVIKYCVDVLDFLVNRCNTADAIICVFSMFPCFFGNKIENHENG